MTLQMNDTHRMFLQALMTRRIMQGKEVKKIYNYCHEACDALSVPPRPTIGTTVYVGKALSLYAPSLFDNEGFFKSYMLFFLTEDANLSQFVVAINSNIRLYNMEIKKGVNEVSGAQYYALVNLSDSPVTRLAADFTPLELELFKKMMDMIVYSDNGIISSIDAINLTSVLDKKMSKDAAESLVQRLAIDKWINVERGDVSLAVRGILELDQYLRETYGELLLTCNMCKQICLQGQKCDSCDTKLHRHCAARYFGDSDAPHCPDCQAPWQHGALPHHQRAEPHRNGAGHASQTSQTSQNSSQLGKRRRK